MAKRKREAPTMDGVKKRLVSRLRAYPILNKSLLTFNIMPEITAKTANRALTELVNEGKVEKITVIVGNSREVDAYCLPEMRARTIDEIIKQQGESDEE